MVYGSERRKYPRFDIELSLKNFDLNVMGEIKATTRDISSKGIGCVSDIGLPTGSNLDIWLYLPDGEAIHTEGKVAWITRDGISKYRMGICLTRDDLKPIPIVLKTIHLKSRYYS
ncbi:MAG: PilZ domain-containing protein [Deltaproteobacteria bacterium]